MRWWHALAAAAVAAVGVTGVIAGTMRSEAELASAACRLSASCGSRGQCSLSAAGSCIAAKDADCEISSDCVLDGKCSADHGVCRALRADDDHYYSEGACRVSDGCRQRGACFLENERCVPPHAPTEPPADSAMKTFACDLGQCVEFDGHVIAVADLPCLRSSGCTTSGLCSMIEGQCVVREPWHCQRSVNCAWAGACSIDDPSPLAKSVARRCVARTYEDCAKTPGCMAEQRCQPSHGLCEENGPGIP